MTDTRRHVLVCTDLDRTLLPNGPQQESPSARPRFRALAARPEVHTAYVTGRHRELVLDAIAEYDLPVPDLLIGDVGTSIWRVHDGDWQRWDAWDSHIGDSWAGAGHDDLARLLGDIPGLTLQEPEKQGLHKLSWYTPEDWDRADLLPRIQQRLTAEGVQPTLIWSLDESTGTGLLDLLPAKASKQLAIEFLIGHADGYDAAHTVFSGDSGNDLAVLISPIQATLVANATDEVRAEAVGLADAAGTGSTLYLAQGDFEGMNGFYAAGILEGLAHYIPETVAWWRDVTG
jgi:hydroxymethylpyrimidine pyrophosphatase-like HAD family hydrolase